MRTRKKVSFFAMLLLTILGMAELQSCKKNTDPVNPYANIVIPPPAYNPTVDDLPEGSFAWLHGKIFKPTCANSGCHDGTFEPEFRSISSAYNSLVNHPVISNNPGNTFEYRVVPFNSAESWLHERLTVNVENTSGMMPLEFGDSDWPENNDYYIQKITDWINSGAKDMYGNPAPSANANTPPLVYGMVVYPHNNTTTPYTREVDSPYGIGGFEVPNDLVDVWILPYDDNAGVNQFESISLKASASATDFGTFIPGTFSLQTPIAGYDFNNEPQSLYYKCTLDLSTATPGETWYMRCYVDDGVQTNITEIPNNSSQPFWYLLFSLKIQ
ncbi:MAG: hypothetical protein ACKVOK_02590 [Flavobacteriales bacterium]